MISESLRQKSENFLRIISAPSPIHKNQKPFSINFLRQDFVAPAERQTVLTGCMIYGALHLLVLAIILLTWMIASFQTISLQGKLKGQLDIRDTAFGTSNMDAELQGATRQTSDIDRINMILKRKFLTAEKLAAIVDTIPFRTWIDHLSARKDSRAINIQATYLTNPDDPHALPVKEWMDRLKKDARFSSGLKRLDFVTSSRQTQGKAELFVFELAAEWTAA